MDSLFDMSEPSKSPEVTEPPVKKPRITNDDLYRNSTQFELWSFTPDNLKDTKRHANEKGAKVSKENLILLIIKQNRKTQMYLQNTLKN